MSRTPRVARRALVGVAAATLAATTAAPALAQDDINARSPELVSEPSSFTSMWSVMADPDQLAEPGEPGASGRYDLRIDSDSNIICFDIVLNGVTGDYESPANTATHIHEADAGEAGPPRVLFPDPTPQSDGTRATSGCVQVPQETGLSPEDSDTDHGAGFNLSQIESNPTGFFVDTHTADFPAGAIRGQIPATPVPMGGMDTGDGSVTAATTTTDRAALAGATGLLALGGLALVRRRIGNEAA